MIKEKTQAVPTFVAAVIVAPFIFQVGFNLGAFKTVMVEHLMMALAASLAAFGASFVTGGKNAPGYSGTWWMRTFMLLPTLWLASEWLLIYRNFLFLDLIELVLGWGMILFSTPAIIVTLILAAYPGVDRIKVRRYQVGLFVIYGIAALGGWLVGSNHFYFVTCDDFELSGAYVPENCWRSIP